jgi:hypothetical protein
MSEPTYNLFSQTSYYIESLFNRKKISSATCFFVSRSGKTYLITNWHVVTGKNPNNNSQLGYFAVRPDELKVKVYKKQENIETVDLNIPLFDRENKKWLEHPVHGQLVDVIAIEIDIPEDNLVFSPELYLEPLKAILFFAIFYYFAKILISIL